MDNTSTRYDLVIFGATGYTGKWVVEELAKITSDSSEFRRVTWAVAGRSKIKLKETLSAVAQVTELNLDNISIIEADTSDEASLLQMAKKSRVVINCVGPYRFYGEAVVKACVEGGASHLDISGEPQYLEEMQLKYDKAAKENNVYVIGACGFDSIPADIGSTYLINQFKGDVNWVQIFISMFSDDSTASGSKGNVATWESLVHGLANRAELQDLRRKLFPTKLPRPKPRLPRSSLIQYNNDLKSWCIPFPGSDHSVVMRTQRWLYENEKQRPAQVSTMLLTKSLFATILVTLFGMLWFAMSSFSFTKSLLLKFPRVFSGGFFGGEDNAPSRLQCEKSGFCITIFASGWSERLAEPTDQHQEPPTVNKTLKITGRNPGYGACSLFVINCALSILYESEKLPKGGGVLTTGSAFGKTDIVKRLQSNGINFELTDG